MPRRPSLPTQARATITTQVKRLPQAARLAIKSSVVYGAVTLGFVILASRVVEQFAASQRDNTPSSTAPKVAAPTPARMHMPTAFDESLVAFNSFTLLN